MKTRSCLLGMALEYSGDTTNGTTLIAEAYVGSFGNTNAESPCKVIVQTVSVELLHLKLLLLQ